MKILMLISSLDVGGAETHVCELSISLSRLGCEVWVASGGGRFAKVLERAGIRHIELPLWSKRITDVISSYRILRSLVRTERFDVIHAHSRVAAYIGDRLSESEKVCFVTTAHARFEITPIKKYMSRWGYYVSAVSDDLALYLRSVYGICPDKIRVIPNGIDTCRFKPRGLFWGRRILFVSRLDTDSSEGAYSLCRIAEKLSKRYRDVSIEIIGGGAEYDALRALSEDINRRAGRELVSCLGPRTDIETHMARSRIFVGVSRAALEAMSCGVPTVLAGNEGFFGEVRENNISDAESSNFCGRGCVGIDDERLLSEIFKLLDVSDRESSARGAFLRSYVEKYHGIERAARQTLELYREAVSHVSFGSGDVCLCGYYGFGNLGDDTLLCEAIKRAGEKYGGGIVAFTKRPRKDRYRFDVRCVSRNNIFAILREIRRAGCLVFGGGTLLQDRTSLRSLAYYLALIEFARLFGTRVELWGSGIGPVNTRIGRRWLSRALGLCSYIGLRDRQSEKIALSLGADRKRIVLERDLAFNTQPSGADRTELILRIYGLDSTEKFAVIALSGMGSDAELKLIKKRISELLDGGIKPIFLSMYPREDRDVSLKMSRETGGIYVENISGGELISVLRRAELSCGMRLHLLIFSRIAGIRFEGVGSDPKIRAFCEENGGVYIENGG